MKKSNILAHRGLWNESFQKNSKEAIFNALLAGYGIETDIRDRDLKIIISHDPPSKHENFYLYEIIEFYIENNCNGKIALNVKSDGLINLIKNIFSKNNICNENFFFFDMSIPDQFLYMNSGLRFFERLSEYETIPKMENKSCGYWIDNFGNNDLFIDQCKKYVTEKQICAVSSELHGRDQTLQWEEIRINYIHKSENFLLCTDMPNLANNFFK